MNDPVFLYKMSDTSKGTRIKDFTIIKLPKGRTRVEGVTVDDRKFFLDLSAEGYQRFQEQYQNYLNNGGEQCRARG